MGECDFTRLLIVHGDATHSKDFPGDDTDVLPNLLMTPKDGEIENKRENPTEGPE